MACHIMCGTDSTARVKVKVWNLGLYPLTLVIPHLSSNRPVSRRISRQPKKIRLSRRKKTRLAGAVIQVVYADFAVRLVR